MADNLETDIINYFSTLAFLATKLSIKTSSTKEGQQKMLHEIQQWIFTK